MADPQNPPVPPATPKADPPKPKSAAELAADRRKAAETAREQAEAKVEAAKRLLAEAEAELKKDWKPGSSATLTFDIPRPQFGSPPRINGKAMVGRCELTYNQFQRVMRSLSGRAEHEAKQRYGYHEGERYLKVQGTGAAAMQLVI